MGITAVLFDMDGTLVDSDAAVERSWRTWARRHGVDETHVLAVMGGHPAAATVRRVRPDLDEDAAARATAEQLALECADADDVVATPGAHDAVAAVERAGLPWAVVTSADTALARVRLGAAGLEPPVLVAHDTISRGKPDPEGYLVAARLLGVAVADCLVVEDSDTGAAAGRAAGARVAGVRGLRGPDVDVTLADLHGLPALLTPHSSEVRA